jgi:hypothetical protein
MARKKNATFVGTSPFVVDVDAETLKSTIENAIGDTALIFDKLTGSNGETSTINHTGGPRGSVLGVPLWNQHINRTIGYTGTGAAKGGTPGPVFLLAMPFFLPDGETSLTVRVVVASNWNFQATGARLRITSTTGTTQKEAAFQVAERFDSDVNSHVAFEANVSGLTTSTAYLCFVEGNTQGFSSADRFTTSSTLGIVSWHGYFPRERSGSSSPPQLSGANVVGVTTPSATEGLAHINFQDTTFAIFDGLDGYQTTYLLRNLHSIDEFGSGFPAGGNSTYTHVDHTSGGVPDDSDPARSRFHAGTRTLYANEPEFDFPGIAECCGSFGKDGLPTANVGATQPTAGMLSFFTPYPLSATLTTLRRVSMRAPDFQTATSKLKWIALVAGDALANWSVTVDTGVAPTSTGAVGAAFAVGGSATCLGVASGSALGFTGDAIHSVLVQSSKSTAFAGTYTEFFLVGFCLYWEP